jgi:hypothetical protein
MVQTNPKIATEANVVSAASAILKNVKAQSKFDVSFSFEDSGPSASLGGLGI